MISPGIHADHMYLEEIVWVANIPDSKIHGANMGPTWVLSAPDGSHVGPMNLAISGKHATCQVKIKSHTTKWHLIYDTPNIYENIQQYIVQRGTDNMQCRYLTIAETSCSLFTGVKPRLWYWYLDLALHCFTTYHGITCIWVLCFYMFPYQWLRIEIGHNAECNKIVFADLK